MRRILFCLILLCFANRALADCSEEATDFLLKQNGSDHEVATSSAAGLYQCLAELLEVEADVTMVEMATRTTDSLGCPVQLQSGSFTYSDDTDGTYDVSLLAAEAQKNCNCTCTD